MISRKILITSLSALFAFSVNVSMANMEASYSDENALFLPDCDGLLPENYEYFTFLEQVAEKFISDNTKQAEKTAQKLFFLIGLRNTSVFKDQDTVTLNSAKDIDTLVAEKLCAFANGKNKNDLWNASPIIKKWIAENIDSLITEVEHNIKLLLEIKGKLALSEKEAQKRKEKLQILSDQGEKTAEKRIKTIMKTP